MAIKNMKSDFKIIKLSKKISPKRKRLLLENLLFEIDLLYFDDPRDCEKKEKDSAIKLYSTIQTYIHLC